MSTKISYLDETWNPVTGCSGRGCKAHCWARDMVKRFPMLHGAGNKEWMLSTETTVDFSQIQFHPDRLDKPLHWRKPRRVGVCFMGDLFDEGVKFDWQHEVWDMMKRCPQHQFFVLTKQPENMGKAVERIYSLQAMGAAMGFWSHVYLGVSICDQADADRMIPDLLRVPGKRWISIEPMLGPVDLGYYLNGGPEIDNYGEWQQTFEPPKWVVIGCESGPKRRRCEPEWVHDVVVQCSLAGVPVYVKQLDFGGHVEHDPEKFDAWARRREMP